MFESTGNGYNSLTIRSEGPKSNNVITINANYNKTKIYRQILGVNIHLLGGIMHVHSYIYSKSFPVL